VHAKNQPRFSLALKAGYSCPSRSQVPWGCTQPDGADPDCAPAAGRNRSRAI